MDPQTSVDPHTPSKRPYPRPMVNICISFLCGIVYARFFPFEYTLAFVCLLFLLAVWWKLTRDIGPGENKRIHLRIFLCLTALIGALRMETLLRQWNERAKLVKEIADSGEHLFTGTIEEIRILRSGKASAVLANVRFEKRKRNQVFPGRVELYANTGKLASFLPGDQIQTRGQLVPIQGPSLPTGMNYQEYRFSHSIYGTISIDDDIHIVSIPSSSSFQIGRLRGFAYTALRRIHHLLPEISFRAPDDRNHDRQERLSLLSSICLGIRGGEPVDLQLALSTSGLAHVTSISGLHVSLILLVIAYALKGMGLKRKHAGAMTILLGIVYLLFTGARIPTLRAVMMAFVFIGQFFAQRKVDPLNSLALAACVLVLICPGELFLPSFQLSFTAVLFLILHRPMSQWLDERIRPRWLAWIPRSLLASFIVTAALFPFIVHYFHIWSWGAIPGNLLAIPIVGCLLPLTYFWIASSFLSLAALTNVLGYAVAYLVALLQGLIHFFSDKEMFWGILASPGFPLLLFPFLILLVLCREESLLIHWGAYRIRHYHAALALIALAVWIYSCPPIFQPLRVDCVSLGQGDCNIVCTPSGKTILVDGGPKPDDLENRRYSRLTEFLLAQGIRRIDLMVLTHPQSDHIGALGDVAAHFPVGLLIEGKTDCDSQVYQTFLQTIRQRRIPRKTVLAGDRIQIDPAVEIWTLHPTPESLATKDLNENSVVLRLQYHDFDLLLTGDIGKSVEKELCDRYENWAVDLLKVPHHGSRYSSSIEFLREIHPQFAIIETGRNSYGHPHEETQKRLHSIYAHILRTDRDGTVQLRTFGTGFRIHTTRSNHLYIHN